MENTSYDEITVSVGRSNLYQKLPRRLRSSYKKVTYPRLKVGDRLVVKFDGKRYPHGRVAHRLYEDFKHSMDLPMDEELSVVVESVAGRRRHLWEAMPKAVCALADYRYWTFSLQDPNEIVRVVSVGT